MKTKKNKVDQSVTSGSIRYSSKSPSSEDRSTIKVSRINTITYAKGISYLVNIEQDETRMMVAATKK